ncbi:hypothetical protein QOZ80_2AG0118010 [Eleusine coracana subsp. coracana]|nr:hypothetical protein QOZ80_2AG0118010 [Eleusine coracana subsp. coracana]
MFISIGLLLGYVSNYAFASLPTHLGWRVMFAAGVLAMPESPRWLAMRGRHDEARVVLARTSDDPAEAELRFQDIIKQAVNQASGIDAVVLYSSLVFKRAGMASDGAVLVATVAVGVVKACFVLVATLLSDRLGRRPLLLASP